METSLVFAKAFGFYLTVSCLALTYHYDSLKEAANTYAQSPALILMTSAFTLFLGAFLIAFHNQWAWSWPLIVTLLCWITFLKGCYLMLCPSNAKRFFAILDKPGLYKGLLLVMLLVGVFLLLKGFLII